MLETPLRRKITKALQEKYPGVWYKIHGGPMQEKGIPDILGCYKGRFVGFEVKRPGKDFREPTLYQKLQLKNIKKAGGISGVITCFADAVRLLESK